MKYNGMPVRVHLPVTLNDGNTAQICLEALISAPILDTKDGIAKIVKVDEPLIEVLGGSSKSRKKKLFQRVEDIRELHKVQYNDPASDTDDYMRGMYNGLEVAMALLDGRNPAFKEPYVKTTSSECYEEAWKMLKEDRNEE